MRNGLARALILVSLVAAAAIAVAYRARTGAVVPSVRLSPVATAHQLGPVGYRDPAGAISPDGRWIAYSEGRFLRVQPIGGGSIIELPPGDGQIRHLVWHPDSRTILADGDVARKWIVYDVRARTRQPLWPDRDVLRAASGSSTRVAGLGQPSWSADGRLLAALVNAPQGQQLWVITADGTPTTTRELRGRASFPTFTPDGRVACVDVRDGRSRVTIPCDERPIATDPDLDVYGPIAFAGDGRTIYAGMPNQGGTLDLWAIPAAGGRAARLTSFSHDTYAPSVSADGTVAFKVQSYRTVVALAPADGGPSRPLATFRTETPSWDPTGRWMGVTYGTWRRVIDDVKYPDIAQETGIIAVDPERPASAVARVVHASDSEDQSLCWSPNRQWVAFHSHKDQSDDIWLRAAAGDATARRITFLGRGAETGWPRWSPDGRWILFDGASKTTRESVLYAIGIDQANGKVTEEAREIAIRGVSGDVSHGEWLPDSARVIVLAKEAPGRHVIFTVARDGGDADIVLRFASEHDAPGLAVSPDGKDAAFIAPAPDGFFQVFRLPLAGGERRLVTTDRSHKTQPAWSPDGNAIAFTVWSYDAEFIVVNR